MIRYHLASIVLLRCIFHHFCGYLNCVLEESVSLAALVHRFIAEIGLVPHSVKKFCVTKLLKYLF